MGAGLMEPQYDTTCGHTYIHDTAHYRVCDTSGMQCLC